MTTLTAPETLEEIRNVEAGQSYPLRVLRDCRTALVLFAAGFYGRQDAFWVAEAGLTATCVDNDEQLMAEMERVYPSDWCFLVDDAYEYAEGTLRHWDIVSVDCPSGAFDRCADLVGLWCSRARHAVILGTGIETTVAAPRGWRISEVRHRSNYDGGVFWTVLERTSDD